MHAHLARRSRALGGHGSMVLTAVGADAGAGYRSGTAYAVVGVFLGLLAVAGLVHLVWGRRAEVTEAAPSPVTPRVVVVPDDTAPTVRLHGEGVLVVVALDPSLGTVSWFASLT